jgi:glycine/D-amino acid oxidase-like deaminating enzyme
MNARPQVSKVVVVGGGIFGVSSAVNLVRLGIKTVLVNDGPLANGASGRSLSWLNSSRRRSADYHRLRMAGIDRYRTLASKNPSLRWLRFDGGLTWDADDENNEISDIFRHERHLGYEAHLLSSEKVAAYTPGVDAKAITPQGAIFNPGEGWVDLPSLITFLSKEFVQRGGELVTSAGRAVVTVTAGRATGVTTEIGLRIDADAVLVATGADVPGMAAAAGSRIAEATPIALLVRSKPLSLPLRAVLNTPRVAIRLTPTGALVLDSAWSEEEVIRHPDGSFGVRESTVQGLLDEASKVLEGNPKLELETYGVGLKPIPGDGEPVFGELAEAGGYFVAFSHSGATLGLIAGELLADEIANGARNPLFDRFRPERFS